MINPFKKNGLIVENREVFTGKVRFVRGHSIIEGEIFGKPFSTPNLLGGTHYHIVSSANEVYDIPAHAIERLK